MLRTFRPSTFRVANPLTPTRQTNKICQLAHHPPSRPPLVRPNAVAWQQSSFWTSGRNHTLRAATFGPLSIRRALATITNTPANTTTTPRDPEFESNPILNWTKFPNYASVQDDHVVPAMKALVKDIESKFLERSKNFEPS
ncbi:hypothetical protein BGZ73_001120, partial [Actinomortierella ambigua]